MKIINLNHLASISLISQKEVCNKAYPCNGAVEIANFGNVVYEFKNACDEIVHGQYTAVLRRASDGTIFLVLVGRSSDHIFITSEGYTPKFRITANPIKPIGVSGLGVLTQTANASAIAYDRDRSKFEDNI